jgi:hypothetical protein
VVHSTDSFVTYRMPSVSLVYVMDVTDSLGGTVACISTTFDVCRIHSVLGDTGVSSTSPRKITDSVVRGARWPRLRAYRVMNTPPAVGTCRTMGRVHRYDVGMQHSEREQRTDGTRQGRRMHFASLHLIFALAKNRCGAVGEHSMDGRQGVCCFRV